MKGKRKMKVIDYLNEVSRMDVSTECLRDKDVWSYAACLGYVMLACKRLNMDIDFIEAMFKELKDEIFHNVSVEEAIDYYMEN